MLIWNSDASPWSRLVFSYTTKVVWLGNLAQSLDIGDLPILPAGNRASVNYTKMRNAIHNFRISFFGWKPTPGSGWQIVLRLARLNWIIFTTEALLSAVVATAYYSPYLFLQQLIKYLEVDPTREHMQWGLVYVVGIFLSNAISCIRAFISLPIYFSLTEPVTDQLWTLAMTVIAVRLKTQLNSILFAKTLVRKDVASASTGNPPGAPSDGPEEPKKENSDEFTSKAQVMTLMTTDVDRVSEFAWHFYTLVGKLAFAHSSPSHQITDAPIEIAVGTYFLYRLLGMFG